MVVLNGTNYHLWKGEMKDLLFVMKLHLPVFTKQKPYFMSEEEWDFEHQQVCGFIRQYVKDNVYNHIANETHARALSEKIESLYAYKSGNNKLYLLNCFMNLRYRENSSISDHLNEFQGLLDQLSGMGIKLWDYGCLILYQSLGRYFGFQLRTLPRMVLFLFRWQRAVLLMKR